MITVKTKENWEFFYFDLLEYQRWIYGTTTHSGLGIQPTIKVLDLNDKSKAILRNEMYMVSSDLWQDIVSRFGKIFMTISGNTSDGYSVMAVMTNVFKYFQLEKNLHFHHFL